MSRLPLYLSIIAVLALAITPVLTYRGESRTTALRSLVIVTPHNEQIRREFADAFIRWHKSKYNESVGVDWSTPGGTSEIRRMLIAQYEADLMAGQPVGGHADLLFGGGSYEFHSLSKTLTVTVDDEQRSTTILAPCDWLSQAQLDELYGRNEVDGQPIYDPKRHWFGAALSTFGIVSNTHQCELLGIKPPEHWEDLATPKLFDSVALVNPAQSGSVATAFETILQRLGWRKGWQVLRRAAANSNQILAASSGIPTSVGDGESATGLAIDFYGRYQVQALHDSSLLVGVPSIDRLTFTTPLGESVVDADPIAMLRGAPNQELAQRFIEFCLSIDGQLLWQLPAGTGELCGHSRPAEFSLRRLPARRAAYECCQECFVDKVDPFANQNPMTPNPNFRDFVSTIFVPMAISEHDLLRAAWKKIITHPAYPNTTSLVTAESVSDPQLKEWIEAFDRMPTIAGPNQSTFDLNDPSVLGTVRSGWIKGGFRADGLWEPRDEPVRLMRRRFTQFFAENYRQISESTAAVARGG